MGAIFEEVVAKNRKHASARPFERNCQSYGWEGDEGHQNRRVVPLGSTGPDARRRGDRGQHPPLPRLLPAARCCTPSQSEMKRVRAALRALVKHCAAGALDAAETSRSSRRSRLVQLPGRGHRRRPNGLAERAGTSSRGRRRRGRRAVQSRRVPVQRGRRGPGGPRRVSARERKGRCARRP